MKKSAFKIIVTILCVCCIMVPLFSLAGGIQVYYNCPECGKKKAIIVTDRMKGTEGCEGTTETKHSYVAWEYYECQKCGYTWTDEGLGGTKIKWEKHDWKTIEKKFSKAVKLNANQHTSYYKIKEKCACGTRERTETAKNSHTMKVKSVERKPSLNQIVTVKCCSAYGCNHTVTTYAPIDPNKPYATPQ